MRIGKLANAPLWGSTAVLFASAAIVLVTGPSRLAIDDPASQFTLLTEEFAARAMWVASAIALTVAILVIIAVSLRTVQELASRFCSHAILFAAALFGIAFAFSFADERVGSIETWELVKSVRTRIGHYVSFLFHFIDASAAFALGMFIAACRALVTPSNSGSFGAATIATRMRRARTLLFCTSAGLLVAIAEIYALYGWIATYSRIVNADFRDQESVALYGTTVAGFVGTVSTLLLLGGWLPACLLLRAHAFALYDGLDEAVRRETTREVWLKQNELSVEFPQQAIAAASLVAPYVAGAVSPGLMEILNKFHEFTQA